MKLKFFKTVVTMAAAVFLSSCVEDEIVSKNFAHQQKFTAEVPEFDEDVLSRSCVDGTTSTGSIVILWQPNDKIGVFTQDGKEGNVAFSNTSKNLVSSTNFVGEISGTPYYAYFPYSSENDGRAVTELKGSIFAEQPYNHLDGTLVCDYKYGACQTGSTTKFKFMQLFSLLRFTVDASGTSLQGERLNYVSLKVTDKNGNERAISGDFTFNAKDGSWNLTGNASGTITMPWTSRPTLANGKSFVGYINLLPEVQGGDTFHLEVATEGHKASFTATIKSGYQAGYAYSVPLKLSTYKSNATKYSYKETTIDRPTFTSFNFEVAKNEGKLLDNELKWNSSNHTPSFTGVSTYSASIDNDKNEITLTIPYLYDFKLKPTFVKSSDNSTVLVNGVEQTSGETEVDFTKPVTYTVVGAEGGTRDYTVKVVNTGLPVVVVKHSGSGDFNKKYKGGVEIFGNNIGGTLVNQFVDFMVRGKDTDWVEDDQITVYNADGTLNCDVTGGVRLRGNTTQTYPKKPLAIKLNSKTSVLGMPAHKRWVLLANQLDHSMIRNTIAFDIAHVVEYAWRLNSSMQPGIPWCPSGQNVELVVVDKDGDAHHVGNYFLGEQIKIDENRLNILDPMDIDTDASASDYTQFGYLIEGVTKDKKDEPSNFTSDNGIIFQFKDELNSTILNQVKTKMNRIESNIINGNYATAYEELDIHSLIDQMLIWELTLNREYGDPSSVYMYLDGAGKLSAGPVWDFDRGTFQNQELANTGNYANTKRVKPDNEWMYWRKSSDESYIWYSQLAKDPTFQQAVKERWANMYPYLQMIEGQIRAYGSQLKASWGYNNAMWPTKRSEIRSFKSDFTDWSGDEDLATFDEVINNMVTVYNERLDGLNTLITSGKFTK